MFWQCEDCVFGTNSPVMSGRHMAETGHRVNEEKE